MYALVNWGGHPPPTTSESGGLEAAPPASTTSLQALAPPPCGYICPQAPTLPPVLSQGLAHHLSLITDACLCTSASAPRVRTDVHHIARARHPERLANTARLVPLLDTRPVHDAPG